MMSGFAADPRGTVDNLVTAVVPAFEAGFGSALVRRKADGSPVTASDVQIEQLLRTHLGELSSFPVRGEEEMSARYPDGIPTSSRLWEGGGDPYWLIDPIDGTANYAAGNPNTAVLVSLIAAHLPTWALTLIPVLGVEIISADGDEVIIRRHGMEMSPVSPAPVRRSIRVAVGAAAYGGQFSTGDNRAFRKQVYKTFNSATFALSTSGSVGVDIAQVIMGQAQAAISFSTHPWDHAAGVHHGLRLGLDVHDVYGNEWSIGSVGAVVTAPEVTDAVLSALQSLSLNQIGGS
ncbi:MAG: inositol monophosphatase family protein [Corynebacterium sp.]|nr:inositol monophosphatase family protein [Corynebacterium sp.]